MCSPTPGTRRTQKATGAPTTTDAPPPDPTIYLGCAAHYLRGRPPYARELRPALEAELGFDGSGTLLDVGCGPGVLAVELAPSFERVIGLDQDADMIAEARRHAAASAVPNVEFVHGTADQLDVLTPEPLRAVTFGQSFHWTQREAIAELVYDRLAPGGAVVLVSHDHETPDVPEGPGDPMIPHDAIKAVIASFLGEERRAGQGIVSLWPDRYEDALARTRFGTPRHLTLPGRRDITRDVDEVISGVLSMSFAAPHLFGDRLAEFVAAVRALLEPLTATGRFWDWPGDTSLLIAQTPT